MGTYGGTNAEITPRAVRTESSMVETTILFGMSVPLCAQFHHQFGLCPVHFRYLLFCFVITGQIFFGLENPNDLASNPFGDRHAHGVPKLRVTG